MEKKLEEIFWEGNTLVNEKGEKVKAVSRSRPYSLILSIHKNEELDRLQQFIETDYCFTFYDKRLEINAYCKGARSNNDNGTPVQFYKI